ncbi:MAG: AAA family ATPase, partial [Caldisericia bacterium]|nr:AAA family ATPase [Caldisericia bacterium]
EFERENKIKTVRSRLGRYSSEKHKIELQQVELRTKRDRQVSDISEMGGSPDGYIEDTDVDAMRVELSDKSRQLAEYGAVNMRAVEEAETARERLNFIEGQLNDLAQTDANLRASLGELETRIRENFERVYQTIEKEFRRLADVLFPGAVGNLKRIRDENTETIGVQVEFMLPGRRMKNLHGLSGGEKTLGALALLFAFFRTKSSPFCVLDEVDAALDDNNVERFTKLLRTEAKDTQFVVITHNKETMRWCDTLYGITLDSSGTSMVVGVKLDEKDKQKKLDSVS